MTLTNGFKLDNVMTTDQEKVKERLSNFWLSDENIIYIGKATDLGVRVNQYYKTAIAKSGPHSGGHWIKLLNNIESLTVHYFPCQQPEEIEYILLDEFGKHVSAKSYKHLIDKDVILPFANLEKKKIKRFIKKHGLEGMRL